MEAHVRDRSWQLARALDVTEDAEDVLKRVRSVRYEHVPRLLIQETLSFVGRKQPLDPRSVGAVFLPHADRLVRSASTSPGAPIGS